MSVLAYWNSLLELVKRISAISTSHSTLSSYAFFIRPNLRFVNVTCNQPILLTHTHGPPVLVRTSGDEVPPSLATLFARSSSCYSDALQIFGKCCGSVDSVTFIAFRGLQCAARTFGPSFLGRAFVAMWALLVFHFPVVHSHSPHPFIFFMYSSDRPLW